MMMLRSFLVVLIIFFSSSALCSENIKNETIKAEPSLYDLILKLENDLREKKNNSEIAKDITLIKEAKKKLPVSYIPELNYLVSHEVEKVPPSQITTLKKLVFHIPPLTAALKVFIFLTLFFTLLTYIQSTNFQPIFKRVSTVIGAAILTTFFIIDKTILIFFLSGFGLVLLLSLKKNKWSIYFLGAILTLLALQTLYENASLRLKSEETFYSIKVERDGYVPHHLIDKVLKGNRAKVEKVTSDLALGKLSSVLLLKDVKANSPLEKALVLNDYGYAEFLKGNYQKALHYFKTADKIYPTVQIKYNLYLSYSSLLKLEDADRLKKELLNMGILVEKLPPIPILIHVPVTTPGLTFPINLTAGLLLGLIAGLIFIRFIVANPGNFDPDLLLFPGIKNFINDNIRPFILISIIIFIVNLFLGRMVCSV